MNEAEVENKTYRGLATLIVLRHVNYENINYKLQVIEIFLTVKITLILQVSIFKQYSSPSRKVIQKNK